MLPIKEINKKQQIKQDMATQLNKEQQETETAELLREAQLSRVNAIASNIDWVVRYAADLTAMTEMDAEPGTILNMMRMYVEDNDDKVDEFKRLQNMIIEAPEERKK